MRELQALLSARGFHTTVDGDYGANTATAVRQFQASEGLPADGVAGEDTWAALTGPSLTSEEDIGDAVALSDAQRWLLEQIPHETHPQARRAIEVATKDLGADEIPDGSNWGGEIQHLVQGYNEYWKVGDTVHYPWCAMACSTWIGLALGLGSRSLNMRWHVHPFKAFLGGAAQIEDWGRTKNRWVDASGTAPPGSLFTMARSGSGSDAAKTARAGHVGMVVRDNGDGTVTTIEGNVSDGVRSRTRKKSDLHGFVAWWP